MAPKKKAPSNGFYYFMMEIRNKQGRSFGNMQEVSEYAGQIWARMDKHQKEPYNERALYEKNNMRKAKYTSTGRDVEELQQEEDAQQEKIGQMREFIRDDINKLNSEQSLEDTLFFIIHINNFCYCVAEDRWYPAELAVAAFSLRKGIVEENIFHTYVKPGILPIGYAAEAKLHADKTHQLERPTSDENNCRQIFTDMVNFIETRSAGRNMILYTDENKMNIVNSIVEMWCADYDIPFGLFKIYSLQYFFRMLKNACADEEVWHSDTFSARELEKDVYDYTPKISCEFHEIAGVQVHCSKSIVTRYTYIICDNCSEYMGITLIKGCHVPHDAKTAGIIQKASSMSSVTSSKTNKSMTESKDDDTSTVKSYGRSDWETGSSMVDDFPGQDKAPARSPDTWDKFNPVPNEMSSQVSYAGVTGRSGFSSRRSTLPSSLLSGVDRMSITTDSESDFPNLDRGRGAFGRGRGSSVGKGRGSAYDRRK